MPVTSDSTWLNLEGIPGPSKEQISSCSGDREDGHVKSRVDLVQNGLKKENGDLLLPTIVVKVPSISGDDVTTADSRPVARTNRGAGVHSNAMISGKRSVDEHQRIFQDILRRKIRESWLDTSYQRAIWNARKRLGNGEWLEDLPEHEKQMLEPLLPSQVKPDYSRWTYLKPKQTQTSHLPSLSGHSSFRSPRNMSGIAEVGSEAFEIYPMEYLSLADRLELHEPPWLAALRLGTHTDSFDQFGLCFGCFQRKGPHYHYMAPIRTGGGYTIYRRHSLQPIEDGRTDHNMDTARWIMDGDKFSVSSAFEQEIRDVTVGDDFTIRLFHIFIDNGGDPNALQEYLESNFDPAILEDLEAMGHNVRLIKEYAELLRSHIREKLATNLEKQSGIVKAKYDDIELVKRLIEITGAGGDLEMLLALLSKGRSCEEILKYDQQGGNVEMLEHYATELLRDFAGVQSRIAGEEEEDSNLTEEERESKAKLVDRVRGYVDNEAEHKHANILLQYMSQGGRLDVLLEYVDKGASSPGVLLYEANNGNISLVREYAEKFPNKDKLMRDLERFVKNHFRNYASAKLLQKYIENGGSVRALKQYVNDGCSFSSATVRAFVKDGGNIRLLQDIGDEFARDPTIKEDLQQFPDDPKVLEAYIRRGGNFPRLVHAIAETIGDPMVEDYVKRRTDEAINDLKIPKEKSKNGRGGRPLRTRNSKSASRLITSATPANSPEPEEPKASRLNRSSAPSDLHAMLESPGSLAHNLLPRLLETARAEMKYDKLIAAEEVLRQNEGPFIAKAVAMNRDMHPLTSVTVTHGRHLPLSFWGGGNSGDSSTVSLLTGKKRPRLWKAPPPFVVKKSQAAPTQPRSPFTKNRLYRIGSLSENHILDIEKRQRRELDVLRRSYRSKDFPDNWRVAVRSPEGSIISEHDSTTEGDFVDIKPRGLKLPEKIEKDKAPKKKDKATRRERQRAKMKAMKRATGDPNARGDSGSQTKRVTLSATSSSSHLSVPQENKMEVIATLPIEENFKRGRQANDTERKTSTTRKTERSRSRSRSKERRARSPKHEVSKAIADLPHERRNLADPGSEERSEIKIKMEREEKKEERRVDDAANDTDEGESAVLSAEEEAKTTTPILPPLPAFADVIDSDDDAAPPYGTAFGKTTPRNRVPVLPEMINEPKTMLADDMERENKKFEHRTRSHKNRKPLKRNGVDKRSPTLEELLDLDELPGGAADDILRKYCIIREERIPRYRHIFDKHLMLKQMRQRERTMKIRRANNALKEDTCNDLDITDEDYDDGPALQELKKCLYQASSLEDRITDIEQEITAVKGSIERATAFAAREFLAKANKSPMGSPRRKRRPNARSVFGGSARGHSDDLRAEMAAIENGKMDPGKPFDDATLWNEYDYNKSARIGHETFQSPNTQRQNGDGEIELPLQDLSDAKIMSMLTARSRKELRNDPVVRHNHGVLSGLVDRLKRTQLRYRKVLDKIEELKEEAEMEKMKTRFEKEKRDKFTRQQSVVYQALHPLDDPVLDLDDVPEALRDVNGEISRADSAVIFEALDFPRRGTGVSFRVFCILAALSESAVSIQPLVRRLSRSRDARALNVKMDKCKEIYGSLLGPHVENLRYEIHSSDFTPTQYGQVMKKLTRDGDRLSFLDFVTYVPLFLDIHQKIVSNPLQA